MDTIIGSAVITGLTLVPGLNVIATVVKYMPETKDVPIGQILLENFVQGIASDTVIDGTPTTTKITSLQKALGGIRLKTTIPPLHQNLITQASLAFPLDIATTHLAVATFALANPFSATISLLSVVANATYGDLFLGQISVRFCFSSLSNGHKLTPIHFPLHRFPARILLL